MEQVFLSPCLRQVRKPALVVVRLTSKLDSRQSDGAKAAETGPDGKMLLTFRPTPSNWLRKGVAHAK
jgi:hypothetical protein